MTRSRKRKLQRLGARPGVARSLAAGVPTLLVGMSAAYAQSTTSGGLEEIVVTAQKRSEDMQSVPVSIQAFGEAKLEQLNVQKFDDYVRYMPSVSYQTAGPGFAAVYMRGVASGGDGNHSGSMPSVGIYLDEQPITTIQGALDVHLYDIERVEALAGPQGTLYGASSQAGTLRIITNKPDPSALESGYGLEYNSVTSGSEGYLAEAFVNLPINDRTAVRLVGWHRHDAGYVDNVPGSRTFQSTADRAGVTPVTQSNERFVEDDYNDGDTTGLRAALKIDIDDNWSVTPQFMAQKQKINGSFAYDPQVGDYKLSHFYPEFSDDKWNQAALTVEGRIANLDVVYSGAYLDRDVDTESDYSDYTYWYDVAYLQSGYYFSDYFPANDGGFSDLAQYINGKDRYNRYTHELRVASDADQRFRFVGGVFLQRQEHDIEQRYKIDNLADTDVSVSGWDDTIWLTKQTRVDEDWALFGEFSFDFTEKLTGTLGGRYFETDNSLEGFFGFNVGYNGNVTYGQGYCNAQGLAEPYNKAPCKVFDKTTKEDGITPRVNLTYKFTDDKMVYATYSEGFRPGGINRRGTLPPYEADWLKNYEIGWKTTWFDNRLRLNGAAFSQEWDDFQFSILGAQGLTEIKNAGASRINGIEMDATWAVTDGLAVTAGVAWLDSELTENYCGFADENGNPVTSNPCPLGVDDDGDGVEDTQEPEAKKGTPLPVTPEWKANATVRYEFPLGTFESYVQGAVIFVDDRRTDLRDLENDILGDMPSYTTADFSAGFGRDNWRLELFVTNAFDELAQLSRFAQCAETVCGEQVYITPQRPRTIALKFSQDF
jgi:outer membrane receptor protein involved in Fe transport